MIKEEYKHSAITKAIIGSAMKVHTTLGNGFQEVIYQRALSIEMSKQGLSFQREMEMDIFYEGEQIGTRRVDFFVEDKVMVELKALTKLEQVHLAQAINYLEAYQIEIGLLINFGATSLEFKRLTIDKKLQNAKSSPQSTKSQNPINQRFRQMKKYETYKESGIEWIGEIPSHWEKVCIKWVSKIYAGGTPSKDKEEYWFNGNIPWLNSGTVNQGYISEPSEYITELGFEKSSANGFPMEP
ncbi:hypothetical protein BH23BAC1_BH23BAC1_45830 [soil metagenome]